MIKPITWKNENNHKECNVINMNISIDEIPEDTYEGRSRCWKATVRLNAKDKDDTFIYTRYYDTEDEAQRSSLKIAKKYAEVFKEL